VSDQPFVDYYDLLQISPNADEDTIERVFRHLAKKCHPDLTDGTDENASARFRLLVQAHEILTDAKTRAGYDARYQEYWNRKWTLTSEAAQGTSFNEDAETRRKLLSLLYVQRRRDGRMPGLGEYEMSRLLRTPLELVEFHLWYLREKKFVQRIDTGQLAITAVGVDEIERGQLNLGADRLLAARGVGTAAEPTEEVEVSGTLGDGRERS
jgi:hypothetical protein